MQAAPSVEARAALAPITISDQPASGDSGAFRPVPIDDDDVPDLPIGVAAAHLVISAQLGRPTYPEIPDEDADMVDDDTKPRPPKHLRSVTEQESSDDERANTVPISLVAPPLEPDPETQTMDLVPPAPPAKKRFPPPAPDTLPERIPTAPMPAIQPSDLVENSSAGDKKDTREVSIWDVFGVERPSDKSISDLEAVIASIQPKTEPLIAQHKVAKRAAPNTGYTGPGIRLLPKREAYIKAPIPVRRPPGR